MFYFCIFISATPLSDSYSYISYIVYFLPFAIIKRQTVTLYLFTVGCCSIYSLAIGQFNSTLGGTERKEYLYEVNSNDAVHIYIYTDASRNMLTKPKRIIVCVVVVVVTEHYIASVACM